jgi:hypothetical protein
MTTAIIRYAILIAKIIFTNLTADTVLLEQPLPLIWLEEKDYNYFFYIHVNI